MHALTCELIEQGSEAYALIPTYYDASRFIAAKVYVEHAWHSDTAIFYHVVITELLDDTPVLIQCLPAALFRTIERRTCRVQLSRPEIRGFDFSKQSLLNSLQAWHKDFVIDLPAPFICSSKQALDAMHAEIVDYFKSAISKLNKYVATE